MSLALQSLFEVRGKKANLFLLFIVLLGLSLRLPFHGEIISGNEALLYSECVKLSQGIVPHEFSASWAPFFLSSWHGWLLSDLRALIYWIFPFVKAQCYFTVIFGILAIIATYRLGNRLYGKTGGLFAALLMAVAPIQASLSYGLSSEIFLTYFILEAVTRLMDAVEQKSRWAFFVSSVFFSGALLSKPLALLFAPAICLYILFNGKKFKDGGVKNVIMYFLLPLVFWLTWAIPNYKRFYSDLPIAFSSFVLKSGSESMRLNLKEAQLFFLSPLGVILALFSMLRALFSRNAGGRYLLFMILSFVFILNLSKNIMLYYYAIIAPFYFIVIAGSILSLKRKMFKVPLVLAALYFIFLNVKTDIINIDLDMSGQNGCQLISDFMNAPVMLVGQGLSGTITELNKIVTKEDALILTSPLFLYEGFIKRGIRYEIGPVSTYIDHGKIRLNENLIKEVKDRIVGMPSAGKIYFACQDGGYYYRLGGEGVWMQSNYAEQLSSCGFKKIYENNYPDEEWLKKCRKYFKYCDNPQWVRNYIFVK